MFCNSESVLLATISGMLNGAVDVRLQAWSYCDDLHRLLRAYLIHCRIRERRVLLTQ